MFDFFSGVACAAALGASVFFARFWRDTADRFFALFALAFAVLALNWLTVSWFAPLPETRHYFYLLRLTAFLLIIAAIVDKNRR